jgi:hypothetical protein
MCILKVFCIVKLINKATLCTVMYYYTYDM